MISTSYSLHLILLLSFYLLITAYSSDQCQDPKYSLNNTCYDCDVDECAKCQRQGVCQRCVDGFNLENNGKQCISCVPQNCINGSEVNNQINNGTNETQNNQTNENESTTNENDQNSTSNETNNATDNGTDNNSSNQTPNGTLNQTNSTSDNETSNSSDNTTNSSDNTTYNNDTNNTNDTNGTDNTTNNQTDNTTDNQTNNQTDNSTDNSTNNNTQNQTNQSLCPPAFIFVSDQCQQCPRNCKKCNADSCTQCLPNYFILDTQCSRCSPGCQQCNSKAQCTVCRQGYILDSQFACQQLSDKVSGIVKISISDKNYWVSCGYGCVSCKVLNASIECNECAVGKYFSQQVNACLPCLNHCLTCRKSGDNITCQSCPSFYTLINSTCVKCTQSNCQSCSSAQQCILCSPGYYLEQNNTCQKCLGSCLVCNFTFCLQCQNGFVPWKGICIQCASNCGSCSLNNISLCTGCSNGFALVDNTCKICSEDCVECDGYGCTQCRYGHGLANGKCLDYCDDECVQCQYNTGEKQFLCQECLYGYKLHDGKCKQQSDSLQAPFCLLHQYFTLSSTCEDCNQTKCEQCTLSSGSTQICLRCQSGYTPNPTCLACNQNCHKCSSPDICQQCNHSYYLQLFLNKPTGRCLPCNKNVGCQECFGFASQCLKCLDGYEREGFKCVTKRRLRMWLHLEQVPAFVTQNLAILKSSILRGLGRDYIVMFNLITIRKFEVGSTNLDLAVSVPPQLNIETSASNILQILSSSDFPFTLLNQPSVQYENYTPEFSTSTPKDNSKAGIIAGCVIGGILLIVLILVVCCRKKKKEVVYGNENEIQLGSANFLSKSGKDREKRRQDRKKGRKQQDQKSQDYEIRSDNFTEDFN